MSPIRHLQAMSQGPQANLMLARYYSSSLGRFMAVDPASDSTLLENPQTWNRYSYTRNNPISRVDPDGRTDIYMGGLGDTYTRGVVGNYVQNQQQPGRDVAHFEFWDTQGAIDYANARVGNGQPMNVIGHSWGGSAAAIVASGIVGTVNTLVGVDSVPLPGPLGMVGRPANVQNVVTVDAQMPLLQSDRTDLVEAFGICVATVSAVPVYATSSDQTITVNAHHGDFSTQMNAPGPDGRSAQQIIDATYDDKQ